MKKFILATAFLAALTGCGAAQHKEQCHILADHMMEYWDAAQAGASRSELQAKAKADMKAEGVKGRDFRGSVAVTMQMSDFVNERDTATAARRDFMELCIEKFPRN